MIEVPKVSEWMKPCQQTLHTTDKMLPALEVLIGNHFPAIPVLDEAGCVVGELSEKDCLRAICRWANEGVAGGTVADHMSPLSAWITPEMDLMSCASQFLACNFSALPVVNDEHKVVGTITRQDVLGGVRQWHEESDRELEKLHAAKPDCHRPSTIAEMQRTLGTFTRDQIARVFRR
jgi:CBS-domain-containing membrane protein